MKKTVGEIGILNSELISDQFFLQCSFAIVDCRNLSPSPTTTGCDLVVCVCVYVCVCVCIASCRTWARDGLFANRRRECHEHHSPAPASHRIQLTHANCSNSVPPPTLSALPKKGSQGFLFTRLGGEGDSGGFISYFSRYGIRGYMRTSAAGHTC